MPLVIKGRSYVLFGIGLAFGVLIVLLLMCAMLFGFLENWLWWLFLALLMVIGISIVWAVKRRTSGITYEIDCKNILIKKNGKTASNIKIKDIIVMRCFKSGIAFTVAGHRHQVILYTGVETQRCAEILQGYIFAQKS